MLLVDLPLVLTPLKLQYLRFLVETIVSLILKPGLSSAELLVQFYVPSIL